MSKRKPPLDEKALAFFRRNGRIGGKRALVTLTPEQRTARAKIGGAAGGRPVEVDRKKVIRLRTAGLKLREVAARCHCGMATVTRIMREEAEKHGTNEQSNT